MDYNLQTRTARLGLKIRSKVYEMPVERGLRLGYRRLADKAGSWTGIVADGKGGRWTERFGLADDLAEGDGISFRQARDRLIAMAETKGQESTASSRPASIDEALTAYGVNLKSRGQSQANERHVRYHLPAELLPVSLTQVTRKQLSDWRNGLLAGGMKPATLNRMFKAARAAFTLTANEDPRVAANSAAWKFQTNGDVVARKAILSDEQIRILVAAAYKLGREFGIYVQVHAETGARSDQIARLTAGDLDGDRVLMPNSGKGKNSMAKKSEHTSIPIGRDLADKLAAVAIGKGENELLLTQPSGQAWGKGDLARRLFRKVAPQLDGKPVTIYSLRHSSIVRALRRGVNVKTVCDWHNTSTRELDLHYARYMRNSHDDLIRAALFNTAPMDGGLALAA